MKKFLVIALPLLTHASPADLRVADTRVVEGDGGTRPVEILILLSTAPTAPVTVNYTTRDGTATAGSDYQAASGTVAFAKGEVSKRIAVNVVGDMVTEPDETFDIVLSNPSGAAIADGTGTVTIVNDDLAAGNRLPMYEVRLTYTGHTGSMADVDGCPVRKNGRVVLAGLVVGDENVPRDDDIEYQGTLWLDVDIDLCEAQRNPNGEDELCSITVLGDALMKTSLWIYADDRGGYVQTSEIPGGSWSQMFGSCNQGFINDEIPMFPNESQANVFNGTELLIPSGPLRAGRYVTDQIVLEVIRKIR